MRSPVYIVLTGALAACGGGDITGLCPPDAPGGEPGVSLTIGVAGTSPLSDPFPMAAGNSARLTAFVTRRDECGQVMSETDAEPVTWTFSDTTVATVWPNGIVHTHRAGAVTVTASVDSASATQRVEVVPLGAVPSMRAVVAGAAQTCAIGTDGTIHCWGDGIPNLCLAVGGGFACGSDYTAGVLATAEHPVAWATCAFGGPQEWSDPNVTVGDFPCSRVPSPYRLGVNLSVVDVDGGSTLGRTAVCGLTDGGALYCARSVGPLEALASGTVFTTVSVSATHACALDEAGRAHCWGRNDYGALGDSTRSSHGAPQRVYGELEFTALEAAFHLTCALATDGRAYCWGASFVGQVGSGQLEACGAPVHISCSLIPRSVSDTVFRQLSVGGSSLSDAHVCGLTDGGTAFCWGGNYEGSLGDGTTEWRSEPTPVGGGLRFQSISAGGTHTCGIATDAAAYCWGSNMWGELGHPDVARALLPVRVTGAPALSEIVAGGVHTCGLATTGAVLCWGWNEGGQLGNGTLANRDTPTQIAGQD